MLRMRAPTRTPVLQHGAVVHQPGLEGRLLTRGRASDAYVGRYPPVTRHRTVVGIRWSEGILGSQIGVELLALEVSRIHAHFVLLQAVVGGGG